MAKLPELLEQAQKTLEKNPEQALQLALKAEELAYKAHDDKTLAWSVLVQGMCHLEENDFSKSHQYLQESLDYANKINDKSLQAASFLQLARSYYIQGDYKAISLNAYEALAIARESNDQNTIGAALNFLGSSFWYFGMYEKALDYYLESIEAYESINYEEVYAVLINISSIYHKLGLETESPNYYILSLENLEKALDGAVEHNNKKHEGICLYNLANVYKDLGNYQEAIDHLEQAEHILKASDITTLPLVYKIWGATHTFAGNLLEGLNYYKLALDLLEDYPNAKEKCEVLLGIGENHIKQQDYSSALSVLHQALDLAKKQGAKPNISNIHLNLNYACEGLGNLANALEHHKEYHRLKSELSQERARQRFEGLMAQFEVERLKKEKEIAHIKHVEIAELNKKLEQKNLELQRLNKRLEQLAIRDSLTKVFNRRYLDEFLVKEWQRAQRYQSPLSLMISDIDNFKQINDTFSHAVGDEVLKVLGKLFTASTRDSDLVARYGGEEFVVVFPHTEIDKAIQAAEKLRLSIESYSWSQIKPDLKVTISAGLAVSNGDKHYKKLFEKADKKLYEAKHEGKNRVCH